MAYYVSRGGGLGAVVPLSRMSTGIGAFMWSDFRRGGLRGLGGGLGGGLDPPSAECPQPVHTDERDALRNEIKGYTNPYQGPHEHENHPDLKAIYNDMVRRLQGLEKRPQLLRCSAEARNRAQIWIGQLEDLRRRAAKKGTNTSIQGCAAATWVHVTEPFQFTVHRGPTYTVRPGSTRPDCFGAGGAQATTPSGPVESTAPSGSVVVNGQVYASSAAAAAATAPLETVGGGGAWEPSPGAPAGFLEASVAGIPMTYLVYGAGALLAWKMLKGK